MTISFVVKLFEHSYRLLAFYIPKNIQEFYAIEATGCEGHFVKLLTRSGDILNDFLMVESYKKTSLRGKLAHAPVELKGQLIEITVLDE